MSPETAPKLVTLFLFGATALLLWKSPDADTRYRRVWGVAILSIGGAALADIAPKIVGMYFGLVIVAYLVNNYGLLNKVAHQIRTQSGVTK